MTTCSVSPYVVSHDDHANVLIVGSEGAGKHEIATYLEAVTSSINMKVHTCTSLPLPEESSLHRSGVHFICFVVNMASEDSLATLVQNLGQVDIGYFMGKSAIVALTQVTVSLKDKDIQRLTQLGTKYGLPVLFRNMEVESEKNNLARVLLGRINLSLGCVPNVSPLVLTGSG